MHRCSPSTQNPRLDTHEVSTMEFFLPQIDQVFLSPGKIFAPWMHWWFHPRSVECLNITKLFRLAVDQFTSSGLDALGQKLGRLDMARAADISRQACAGETFH